MATAKTRRYDEGGVTEGQNRNIDDDTRARAMKFLQQQSEEASTDEGSGKKTVERSTKAKVSSKPVGASADDEAGRSRGRPAEGAPKTSMGASSPRKRTREESIAAIPTEGRSAPSRGERVDSTELGRNASALMNASGPGKLVTGLSLAAREYKAGKAAQNAYNQRAAMRRSGEGLNAEEAAAARARIREASFEGGMKTGGSVKGWGTARGARKAKIY